MTHEHWILLGVAAALAAWDVWLVIDGEPGNAISQIIRRTSRRWLLLPFAFGVLCGHWFW